MSPPRQHVVIWKRLFLTLGILVVVVVLMFGYNLYQTVHLKIPESYDAWTTGTLVVGYLETHSNEWPRSWDDLRDATNFNRPTSVFVPIERLQQSVKIDWRVDVAQLQQIARTNPNATIRVVSRLDGSRLPAMWGPDTEPNRKIMSYLATTSNPQSGADGRQPSSSGTNQTPAAAASRRSL